MIGEASRWEMVVSAILLTIFSLPIAFAVDDLHIGAVGGVICLALFNVAYWRIKGVSLKDVYGDAS